MADAPESLPGLLRRGRYRRSWLRPDVIAGTTVAAMLVPQAMAYAELGGLPPSAGFRAALVALPIYALLGTSRHLGIGPEPGTAVLAALAVGPLAGGDPTRYLALMALLAAMVGAFALVGSIVRLGFIADLLSMPVLVGYISGVGITLLASQLRPLTGVDISASDVLPRFAKFAARLGTLDPATTGVGVGTLAVILVLRRVAPKLPGALIGLAAALAASKAFGFEVSVVGEIDAALPTPTGFPVGIGDVRRLAPSAAGLLLIAYTDNILTARSIAAKQGYPIDANRELLALGAMNLGASGMGGFPMSSSASRSIVPADLGSRTQLSSLVTFVVLILFLLFAGDLLAEIPRSALAAVVVAAAFAVIDVAGFRRLARISWAETGLAAVTCLAIITTDLLLGVLVAMVLSVLLAFQRVARPHDAVLGAGRGLDGWIDVDDDRAETEPGMVVYRFDAPLLFANAEHFGRRVFQAMETNPDRERWLILDFEGVGSLDATAAEYLVELHEDIDGRGARMSVARPNKAVLDVMERAGLVEVIGADRIHLTINAAVDQARDHLAADARGC